MITKHHSHHYIGFAATEWKLLLKESPRRVKPLLYVYRVLLTGIHLMRTGTIEANLLALNEDVLGIIPGSMASPGFVVSGKGNPESLNSAAHGAGRVMSRTQATKTFEWKKVNAFLREKGVTLISAGLDEVPMVYTNIHEVMAAQKDLVTILGQFDPKLVKMAPHGERAED